MAARQEHLYRNNQRAFALSPDVILAQNSRGIHVQQKAGKISAFEDSKDALSPIDNMSGIMSPLHMFD